MCYLLSCTKESWLIYKFGKIYWTFVFEKCFKRDLWTNFATNYKSLLNVKWDENGGRLKLCSDLNMFKRMYNGEKIRIKIEEGKVKKFF